MYPQIIMLVLLFIELGVVLFVKPTPTPSIWNVLSGWAIVLGLLYWGGFWDVLL